MDNCKSGSNLTWKQLKDIHFLIIMTDKKIESQNSVSQKIWMLKNKS